MASIHKIVHHAPDNDNSKDQRRPIGSYDIQPMPSWERWDCRHHRISTSNSYNHPLSYDILTEREYKHDRQKAERKDIRHDPKPSIAYRVLRRQEGLVRELAPEQAGDAGDVGAHEGADADGVDDVEGHGAADVDEA
jgi:hypothetical protein